MYNFGSFIEYAELFFLVPRKLLKMTCQLAHVLKARNIQKGDIVLIYMSSSPIAVAAMLACTRIGAIHRYILRKATVIASATFELLICSVAYAVLKSNELEARIKEGNDGQSPSLSSYRFAGFICS